MAIDNIISRMEKTICRACIISELTPTSDGPIFLDEVDHIRDIPGLVSDFSL